MEPAEDTPKPLPPAVASLKQEVVSDDPRKNHMERSLSQDIREEREDLKEAAEHTTNVILDLNLDGIVKWVSPSWQQVIGTPSEEVIGKPIADILIDDKEVFKTAVEKLQKDDSRSNIIRFSTYVGKNSMLSPRTSKSDSEHDFEKAEDQTPEEDEEEPKHSIDLEGQGILVYDRTTGQASHVSDASAIFSRS